MYIWQDLKGRKCILGAKKYLDSLKKAGKIDPEEFSKASSILAERWEELNGLRKGTIAWVERARQEGPDSLSRAVFGTL